MKFNYFFSNNLACQISGNSYPNKYNPLAIDINSSTGESCSMEKIVCNQPSPPVQKDNYFS